MGYRKGREAIHVRCVDVLEERVAEDTVEAVSAETSDAVLKGVDAVRDVFILAVHSHLA